MPGSGYTIITVMVRAGRREVRPHFGWEVGTMRRDYGWM